MQALHVFEERYKTMVGECLEEESEFGIVWVSDAGLRDVGCSVTIARVVDRMEDGRLNILVQGTTPLRLLRRVDDFPYPAGDVELIEDDPEPRDDEALTAAREAYADLVERVTDARPSAEDLSDLGAYEMAATIAFELEEKQELLELRSESARLERLTSICSEAIDRLDYVDKASERARSNGKVHH
jgi:Lon protease-like protein